VTQRADWSTGQALPASRRLQRQREPRRSASCVDTFSSVPCWRPSSGRCRNRRAVHPGRSGGSRRAALLL